MRTRGSVVPYMEHGPGPGRESPVRALLLALALAAAVGHVLIGGLLVQRLLAGALVGDWKAFYAAGHLVRSGAAGHLFDPAMQAAAERALYGNVDVDNFPLPAFMAFAFAPLSTLTYAQSFLVWLGINVALLAGLTALAWLTMSGVDRATRAAFVLCGAASTPMLRLLTGGQVDLLLVVGLAGCHVLLRRKSPIAAGAVLALGLVKPHLLLGAILLLLVTRQWRTLMGLALVGMPLLLLPVLATGFGGVRDQAALLASYPSSSMDRGVAASQMVNLRGLVVGLTGASSMWAWLPLQAAVSAASVYGAARVWCSRPGDDAQSWALAAVLPLIYSPHVHAYTLVLFLLAGGLYLFARAEAGDQTPVDVVLASSLGLTVVCFVSLLLVPVASLAVLGVFIFLLLRWPHGAAAPQEVPQALAGQARPAAVAPALASVAIE